MFDSDSYNDKDNGLNVDFDGLGEQEKAFIKIERESRLCVALIAQSIRDLGSNNKKVRESAEHWFTSIDTGTYSLRDCCEAMTARLKSLHREITIDVRQFSQFCLENHDEIIRFRHKPVYESTEDDDVLMKSFLGAGSGTVLGQLFSGSGFSGAY